MQSCLHDAWVEAARLRLRHVHAQQGYRLKKEAKQEHDIEQPAYFKGIRPPVSRTVTSKNNLWELHRHSWDWTLVSFEKRLEESQGFYKRRITKQREIKGGGGFLRS